MDVTYEQAEKAKQILTKYLEQALEKARLADDTKGYNAEVLLLAALKQEFCIF